MSSQKRVELTALGPLEKKKPEPKPPPKSVRLNITLDETTDDYFPYIDYEEALGKQLKKIHLKEKKGGHDSSLVEDAFAEEDEVENDKLVEIARRFEEKYGTSNKRRLRLDDHEGLGEGYDDSDSFIDNAEAFEEAVPDEVSPALGGFYINKGTLESKKNDDMFQFKRKKTTVVTSDDENQDKNSDSGRQLTSVSTGGETPSSSTSGKKKKKKEKKRRGDDKHGRKRKAKREKRKEVLGVDESTGSSVADTIERVILAAKNNVLDTPKLKSKGESKGLADGADVQNAAKVKKETKADPEEVDQQQAPPSVKQTFSKPKPPVLEKADAKKPVVLVSLPKNVPEEVSYLIQALKAEHEDAEKDAQMKEGKEDGSESEDEDKVKIGGRNFPSGFRPHLMKLEKACRGMDVEIRTMVFAHLGSVFAVKEDELRRTARDLVKSEEDRRVKPYLRRLKEAVDRAMPDLEKRHQEKCRAAAEGRADEGSDDDSEDGGDRGDKPKTRMPRRKFVWTEDTKESFLDLVQIKVKMLEEDLSIGMDAETYFKDFFEHKVKTLWPKNWMNARELYRESKNVHGHLTNKTRKPGPTMGRKAANMPLQTFPPPSLSPSVASAGLNSSVPAAASPKASSLAPTMPMSAPVTSSPSLPPIPSFPPRQEQRSQPSNSSPKKRGMDAPPLPPPPPQPPAAAAGFDAILAAMAEQMKAYMTGQYLSTASGSAAAAAAHLMNDEALRTMMAMGLSNPAAMAAMMPGFGNLGVMSQPSAPPGTKRHSEDYRQVPEKKRRADPYPHSQPATNRTPPPLPPSPSSTSVSPQQMQQRLQQEQYQRKLQQREQQAQQRKRQQEHLKREKEEEREREREREREVEKERRKERERERQRELERDRELQRQEEEQKELARQREREKEREREQERERVREEETRREEEQALQLLISSTKSQFPSSFSVTVDEDLARKPSCSPRGADFRPSTPEIELVSVDLSSSMPVSSKARPAHASSMAPLPRPSLVKTSAQLNPRSSSPATTPVSLPMGIKTSSGLEVTALPRSSATSTSIPSSSGVGTEVYKPHKRAVEEMLLSTKAPISSLDPSGAGVSTDQMVVESSRVRDILGKNITSGLTLTPISSSSPIKGPKIPPDSFDFSMPFSKPTSVSNSRLPPAVPTPPPPPSHPPPPLPPLPKTKPPPPPPPPPPPSHAPPPRSKSISLFQEAKMSLPILSLGAELDLSAGFADVSSPPLSTGSSSHVVSVVDFSNPSKLSPTLSNSSASSRSERSPSKSSAFDMSQSSQPYQSKKMRAAETMKSSMSTHSIDMGDLLQQEIMKQLRPGTNKQPEQHTSKSTSHHQSQQAYQKQAYTSSSSLASSAAHNFSSQQHQSSSRSSHQSTSGRSSYAPAVSDSASFLQEGLGSRVGQSLSPYNLSSPTQSQASANAANRHTTSSSAAAAYSAGYSSGGSGQPQTSPYSSSSSAASSPSSMRPHSSQSMQQQQQIPRSSSYASHSPFVKTLSESTLPTYNETSSRYQTSGADVRLSSSSRYGPYSSSSQGAAQLTQQAMSSTGYPGSSSSYENQQSQSQSQESAGHPGYFTSSGYRQQQDHQSPQSQNQQRYGSSGTGHSRHY